MPASPDTLAGLLIQEDKATIYAAFLTICQQIGLPVTSWKPGDPSRSLGFLEAETLEALEQEAVGFIGSGFLDFAFGMWLTVAAKQGFNVDVPAAVSATPTVVLTNAGGGIYDLGPGDVTVKNSTTGATYHSTQGGTLTGSGGTLSLTFVADVAGTAGSAGPGEIDTMVTGLLGVTCTNPTAAVGIDQQDPSVTIQQCRDKLASLSPDGPAGAYSFVARNPVLTGINTVTRARVYSASETGDVTVYVAGPSGGVSSPDVAAVQAAINIWATPLCITSTVLSANAVTVNVTYTIWLYESVNQTVAQIKTAIQDALASMFTERPIGGDIIPPGTGALYTDIIESTIGNVFAAKTFRISLSAPSGTTSLGAGDVPVLGTVTGTVNLIPDP